MSLDKLLQDAAETCVLVEEGESLSNPEARKLLAMLDVLTNPKHALCTCWRVIPLPVNTIMLIWNGRTITPPMSFKDEKEVEFFMGLHKPIAYLQIPKPPELPENLKKLQEGDTNGQSALSE